MGPKWRQNGPKMVKNENLKNLLHNFVETMEMHNLTKFELNWTISVGVESIFVILHKTRFSQKSGFFA